MPVCLLSDWYPDDSGNIVQARTFKCFIVLLMSILKMELKNIDFFDNNRSVSISHSDFSANLKGNYWKTRRVEILFFI